jgi:eukaryotic-like serine/threonine-protein kinase
MPLVEGDLLNGRYRILEVLGHGGMGSVYRAHDESLSVDVAVKENLFTTDDYAQQFRLEAVILASLRHPNLPRVTDHFVLAEEGQYLVMDYIEGPDLRQILEKSGPITEEEAIRIGAAICDALDFLHTRKPAVLHRDIKLGNIKLVPDGHICLVDFGLAKILEDDQATLAGARAMTPGYSPPEQYGSSRTDARSDVYSLGATLYAAITGYIPEDSLARAIDGLELTPIRKRNPKISQQLAGVIEKSMETSAENRYQSALEFKQALLGESPAQAVPPPANPNPANGETTTPPEPAPEAKSRGPARLNVFLLLGIAVLLVLSGLMYTTPGILPFQAVAEDTPTETSAPSLAPVSESSPTLTTTAEPTETPEPTATNTATATIPPTQTAVPSPTSEPLPQTTPVGGGNGKIAFVTTREGLPQIYTMNADGSQQERLFLVQGGACQPRWSPDGARLAYISPCRGRQTQDNAYANASIFIYDLNSGETTSLSNERGGDFDPFWSPDGQHLVFSSLRDSQPQNPYSQVYKINLATLETIRLTQTDQTQPARQPAWSPDGTTILYNLRRFGLWQVWSMDTDGKSPAQLARSGANADDFQPAWMPDSLAIYFSQAAEQNAPARLMRLVLGEETAAHLPTAYPIRDVSISPDGNWLAAEGTDGANIDIYLLDLLGNIALRLTNDPGTDFDPHWQP